MTTTRAPLRARIVRTGGLTKVLAGREFRIRYRQSALEIGWSLVTPVASLVVYGVVLTYAFKVDTGDLPFLSTVWTGLVVWTTFATALGGGVYSIVGNADLVAKVYFPREVLPLAVFGAAMFDLLIGLAVLVVLVAIQVGDIDMTVLAVVPALYIMLVWTAALTIFAGIVAAFIRDVIHLVRLLLLIGFFATPVMYVTEGLGRGFELAARINPLAVAIDAMRDGMLRLVWPDPALLFVHAAVGTALLGVAVLYTRAVEDRIVDVL